MGQTVALDLQHLDLIWGKYEASLSLCFFISKVGMIKLPAKGCLEVESSMTHI